MAVHGKGWGGQRSMGILGKHVAACLSLCNIKPLLVFSSVHSPPLFPFLLHSSIVHRTFLCLLILSFLLILPSTSHLPTVPPTREVSKEVSGVWKLAEVGLDPPTPCCVTLGMMSTLSEPYFHLEHCIDTFLTPLP